MKHTQIYLHRTHPPVRAMVAEAAAKAFPGAAVTDVTSLDELGPAPGRGAVGLLILDRPDDALLAAATQAADGNGAPRWAVVVLAPTPSDLAETVTPEDWNARCLSRIFRSTVLQHELLRENLALRGDLRTVARRVCHELRTPVGCIHTSSDLLEELPVGKETALRETANIFRESSREISQIIDRVSYVLRASTDPLTPARVEMGGIVNAALRQLEPEIRATGAVVMQPVSWPEVVGVTAWLQVVWWNLLSNALRHGGPSPVVRITCARDAGRCRFAVQDEGAGVEETERTGLFVPFEDLHGARARGLGLSIVHRLVTLQDGACAYAPAAERGAAFEFSLPEA